MTQTDKPITAKAKWQRDPNVLQTIIDNLETSEENGAKPPYQFAVVSKKGVLINKSKRVDVARSKATEMFGSPEAFFKLEDLKILHEHAIKDPVPMAQPKAPKPPRELKGPFYNGVRITEPMVRAIDAMKAGKIMKWDNNYCGYADAWTIIEGKLVGTSYVHVDPMCLRGLEKRGLVTKNNEDATYTLVPEKAA